MGKPPLHRHADWLKRDQPCAILRGGGANVNGYGGLRLPATAQPSPQMTIKWRTAACP